MRINIHENIAGQSAATIRKFLKQGFDGAWDVLFVMKKLDVDATTAKRVVAELVKRGYVEKAESVSDGDRWENTLRGNAFAGATGAKPLLKKSADQRLKEFLSRVDDVRTNPYFLYRVSMVKLFGSFLTSQDRINDVDLCVTLVPKEKDREKQHRLERRRSEEALRRGKSFSTTIDQLSWPQTEVLKFLKARSRSISLHPGGDQILKHVKSKVIYSDEPQ